MDRRRLSLSDALRPASCSDSGVRTKRALADRPTPNEASVRLAAQRLAGHGTKLGIRPPMRTTNDPGLAVRFKGRTLPPMYSEDGLFIFALPRGATEVKLLSRPAVPPDARSWPMNQRPRGVSVRNIVVRGAKEVINIPLVGLDSHRGWWDAGSGEIVGRWTDGAASLRLPRINGRVALLEVQLNGPMRYVLEDDAAEAAPSDSAAHRAA